MSFQESGWSEACFIHTNYCAANQMDDLLSFGCCQILGRCLIEKSWQFLFLIWCKFFKISFMFVSCTDWDWETSGGKEPIDLLTFSLDMWTIQDHHSYIAVDAHCCQETFSCIEPLSVLVIILFFSLTDGSCGLCLTKQLMLRCIL